MSEFMRGQYQLIFEAVICYLSEHKPFYPPNLNDRQEREIWDRWIDKHQGEINEYIDVVDTIIHTKYKECQFTEQFVDRYFKILKQLRRGIITHIEFGMEVESQLMGMRSGLALAAIKGKEVELVSYD